VIFPIWDLKGKIIAFGGRILGQKSSSNDQAKYINSAETELFHKGQILYNYHHASKQVNKDTPPIVVEGYCDVIALYQAGWKTAVAPLGTALTESQLSLLWRRHSYPLLCFDGDQAGWRASFKAAERALPLLKTDKSLKICYLPKGEDPDSLLKEKGRESLKQIFANPLNLVDGLWNSLMRMNLNDSLLTPEAKARFKKETLDLVKTIQDPDIRRFYELDFSQRLRKILYSESYSLSFKKGAPYPSKTFTPLEAPKSIKGKNDLARKILLATLITHPILLKEVFEQFAALDFQGEVWHNLKQCMLDCPEEDFGVLREKLEHTGFKIILDDLFDKDLTLHAPFAMPGSDSQVALERWKEIWHHTTWKQQVKGDLKQTQEHIKQSFEHKAWEKMKALKNTLVP
jgi:DNA primase